jgi:hypothetical protein
VRETRARILSGEQALESLVDEHVGEIKAHIVERDGKVDHREDLPDSRHLRRHARDNPAFLRRLESLFPGRDFAAVTDRLHNHGTSVDQARPRRGADRST